MPIPEQPNHTMSALAGKEGTKMTEVMAEYNEPKTPVAKLKRAIQKPSVQEQFKNALKDNAELFTASIIDLYAGDSYLQKCDPNLVIMEALKAATLQLPISRALGYAWIVPYKGKPVFQLGYKGAIQLAIRSGQYKYINADVIYEGETVEQDRLTGAVTFGGAQESDKVIGYFAYIQLINGFEKTLVWTREQVLAHAKRYSASFSHPSSPWQTDFDAMALKTVLKALLSKYGIMSIQMQMAMRAEDEAEADLAEAQERMASGDVVDIDEAHKPQQEAPEPQTEKQEKPKEEKKNTKKGKGKTKQGKKQAGPPTPPPPEDDVPLEPPIPDKPDF